MFALLYKYVILALFMLASNYLFLSKLSDSIFCQQWIYTQ